MKKHRFLIYSGITFAFNFILCWFSDVLLDRFFVFGMIPINITLIMLLAGLITAIIRIFKNRKDKKNYIALAIFVVTAITIMFFPFRTIKVKFELPLYEEKRLQIVEMVANGDLENDGTDNIELPRGYKHLSSDGYVHIYQNDDEQVVSFWVFRGMLSGSVQLMYSSQEEELIYANETGHPITEVEMLKEHWYLVNTNY